MDDPSRDEWIAVRDRALRNDKWASWTEEEKMSYVRLLFSPFVVTDDLVSRIVNDHGAAK